MYYCDGYDEYLKSMKRRCRHLDADGGAAEAKGLIGKIASAVGKLLKFLFKIVGKLAVITFDTVTFIPKVFVLSYVWIAFREAQFMLFVTEKLCAGLSFLFEKMRLNGASKFMSGQSESFKKAKEFESEVAGNIGATIKNVRKPWTAITGTR